MAITTYTSGQVLTASSLNSNIANDYNQTVSTKTANYTLVAADKGTRVVMNVASASTVTVNTSLFSAGDTLVIQNIASDATVVTAGTATVSTAGSLSIPQFGSGTLFFTSASAAIFFPSAGPPATSGLTLISAGTKSAATTQSFNAVFTTTYKNYKVIFSQITTSTNNEEVYLRVGTSGTPDSGNNYKFNRLTIPGGGVLAGSGATTLTNMIIIPNSGISNNFFEMTINSPFEAERTIINGQSLGTRASNIPEVFLSLLMVDTATSYTDLSVTTSSGANFTMNFAIYGYQKS